MEEGRPGIRDPEELAAAGAPAAGEIAAATTMGAVSLTVSNLERSVDFYERSVGLRTLASGDRRVALGAGERELLVLVEERGARPSRGYAGLYHFALLLPRRAELARWLAHAALEEVPLVGLSDHFVSEALYLSDPDEHGIEIYWDRPRETWEGQVGKRMTTLPLDVDGLMRELPDPRSPAFDGLPDGTVMGHVHLRVAAIPGAIAFYGDILGFGLMARLGAAAAFFGAGGYHHHVGANVWESAGAPSAPRGTASLRHATVALPDASERDRVLRRLEESGQPVEESEGETLVRDPSGNALLLSAGQPGGR